MKIVYARVSTDEQNLELQRQALEAAGCEIIFEDRGVSGASEARKSLSEALERDRAGCFGNSTVWGVLWRISSI